MSDSGIFRQKSSLRQEILRQRREMGAAARAAASASICRQIRLLPQYRAATCVGAFAPMPEEVDIWPLLQDNKQFALPRVQDRARRELRFYRYTSRAALIAGFKGILEPVVSANEANLISPQDFDFLIIPAVAVNSDGLRLGYGGGFYDKVLANCRGVATCAPIFFCQQKEIIPAEKHDQSITFFISEQ